MSGGIQEVPPDIGGEAGARLGGPEEVKVQSMLVGSGETQPGVREMVFPP